MSNKARYTAGLNGFDYRATLCVHHPDIDPNYITRELGLQPTQAYRVGEPRQTPKGTALSGNRESTYWTTELEVCDGEDLAGFVSRLSDLLKPAEHFLKQVVEEGGRVECFFGIFAFALCDQLFPSRQLVTIGELGVDLRLDYYWLGEQSDRAS